MHCQPLPKSPSHPHQHVRPNIKCGELQIEKKKELGGREGQTVTRSTPDSNKQHSKIPKIRGHHGNELTSPGLSLQETILWSQCSVPLEGDDERFLEEKVRVVLESSLSLSLKNLFHCYS
jgi:hypothetical protein